MSFILVCLFIVRKLVFISVRVGVLLVPVSDQCRDQIWLELCSALCLWLSLADRIGWEVWDSPSADLHPQVPPVLTCKVEKAHNTHTFPLRASQTDPLGCLDLFFLIRQVFDFLIEVLWKWNFTKMNHENYETSSISRYLNKPWEVHTVD